MSDFLYGMILRGNIRKELYRRWVAEQRPSNFIVCFNAYLRELVPDIEAKIYLTNTDVMITFKSESAMMEFALTYD